MRWPRRVRGHRAFVKAAFGGGDPLEQACTSREARGKVRTARCQARFVMASRRGEPRERGGAALAELERDSRREYIRSRTEEGLERVLEQTRSRDNCDETADSPFAKVTASHSGCSVATSPF